MITEASCVVITCDGLGCADKGWPNDGPLHFPNLDAALRYVIGEDDGCGWTKLPDGRLLCRSCSEAADCEVTGHQFIEWRPSPRGQGIQWRFCKHCGGSHEERFISEADG